MRNLKKLLALVLAMAMTFSLLLTASATNPVKTFDDADQITEAFEEAADVLTGMKVFQGDERGFAPGANITRAEVATLIYRLATGDTGTEKMDLYTTTHPFTDVKEGDWFAGYVGYCWNAGYIKGTSATTFNPYANVTGYEALAMVLRAMGYDRNHEFEGSQWIVNVSSIATQRGLLDDIKTTHYANTLHLASRRDVVASILFQAALATRVVYTPAFGYQSGDHTSSISSVTDLYNDYSSLGWLNFGLVSSDKGVVIGNQQTGETNTRLGFPGKFTIGTASDDNATTVTAVDSVTVVESSGSHAAPFTVSAYAWEGKYDALTAGVKKSDGTAYSSVGDASFTIAGNNDTFKVETGIDLIGHRVKIWFDGRGSKLSSSGHTTYAYFDQAKTDVVYADNTALTNPNTDATIDLSDAIAGTDLKVNSSKTAVFNNSFGKFGTLAANATVSPDGTDGDEVSLGTGDGLAKDGCHTNGSPQYDEAYLSPVGLYKIISNNSGNTVDAVIALNIESSQITESNSVNRVPTIGMPVMNFTGGTEETYDSSDYTNGSFFAEGNRTLLYNGGATVDKNLKLVNGVKTAVLAKDALKGNSTSTLGDYEMGIHITGTTRRDVSANEATAINNTADANKDTLESSYFLLSQVTATVEGRVVAYNRGAGTVTLENGTVLERSKFYDTVVIKNKGSVASDVAPDSAIPQGWIRDAGIATDDPVTEKWVEGYANETYKFYTDYEGKYLGAERSYGSSFLYGTYLDYSQETSSSTFKYFLTGVNLNGEVETKQVSKFWAGLDSGGLVLHPSDATAPSSLVLRSITGTDNLGVPFRDTYGSIGSVNGLGVGVYTGFTVNSGTVDSVILDKNDDRNEYLVNMARLGIKYAGYKTDTAMGGANVLNPAFDTREIVIDDSDVTLGARETINHSDWTNGRADPSVPASGKYFTEATKFILVSGFGTDSVKAEVYNGISELKGSAARVFIKMNGSGTDALLDTKIKLNSAWPDSTKIAANLMTYYTESPYTYAQSGDTAMKIDTIILPKAAVSWSGGSGLYYVGNPTYSMINSWGTDAWKYNLYLDGELQQVWLTNDPSKTGTGAKDSQLQKDSFYNLANTGLKANDGEPIYVAGNYNVNGVWTSGTPITSSIDPTSVGSLHQYTMASGVQADGVIYSAVTRDAQTATFTKKTTMNGGAAVPSAKLYRVAEAKVVNLNVGAKANGNLTDATRNSSGEIWPGITDLATLNEAGSIDPVTGRMLKVAAVVDPQNPLVITTIYVCWDQGV